MILDRKYTPDAAFSLHRPVIMQSHGSTVMIIGHAKILLPFYGSMDKKSSLMKQFMCMRLLESYRFLYSDTGDQSASCP